jgi:hypothetical protein
MQHYRRDPASLTRRPLGTAGTALLAVHGVLLLLLAGVVLCSPDAGERISETVAAEFVGAEPPIIAPTQLARPVGDMWSANAH